MMGNWARMLVIVFLGGCAMTSSGLLSQAPAVATHQLTKEQASAIVSAAEPHKRSGETLSAGPMKAIRTADGRIEFCALVYTGQKNLLGSINRYFFAGQFPSATSTSVSMNRATSDAQGLALTQECNSKGMGV
jgi:hypothetical protein